MVSPWFFCYVFINLGSSFLVASSMSLHHQKMPACLSKWLKQEYY